MVTKEEMRRSLTITVVHPIYKDQIQKYFDHYNIEITWKIVNGGELHKTMDVSVSRQRKTPEFKCTADGADYARDRRCDGLVRYRPN